MSDSHPDTPSSRPLSWVPLFVPRGGTEPLATTLILPPLERRRQSYISLGGSSFSSESETSALSSPPASSSCSSSSIVDPDSPTSNRFPTNVLNPSTSSSLLSDGSPTGLGFKAAVSSSVSTMNHDTIMQRQTSTQTTTTTETTTEGANHLRRRSSLSVTINSKGLALDSNGTEAAARMERMRSLTSIMNDPLNQQQNRKNSTWHKVQAFNELRRQQRANRRKFNLVAMILFAIVSLWYITRRIKQSHNVSVDSGNDDEATTMWTRPVIQFKLPTPQSLYDSLETVPYPTSTHPKTPSRSERHKLSFNDYLTTRLGSHFSFPRSIESNSFKRPSHLWLTTATNATVRLSTRHLVSFVNKISTDKHESISKSSKDRFVDSSAIRRLVVLCRDDGCMKYCRENLDMYCFGGFIDSRDDGVSKEGEEIVKLKGTVSALESGRRVFFVDDDVYFKEDPVPHLGPLDQFDLQIPDSWATGKLNAGFIVLNPTSNVISLWQRLLDISLVPSPQRRVWSTTNLLLDPSGTDRDHSRAHSLPLPADKIDTEDDGLASSYASTEFESPWAGGIDVKVLDRKKFRTSSGKLSKVQWDKHDQDDLAIYHHCVCCGDAATNDYIAGALGYHQPEVAYPHLNSVDVESHFPFVLKMPELKGSLENMTYDMNLILQLAHDSKRSFVPPLKATLFHQTLETRNISTLDSNDDELNIKTEQVETTNEIERYIWRLFPIAHWSLSSTKNGPGSLVSIKEPSFVLHLINHLKQNYLHLPRIERQLQQVQDVLWLDLSRFKTYQQALKSLNKPFLSTTTVVMVEGFEKIRGKQGWKQDEIIRQEFSHGVETCRGLNLDLERDDNNDGRDKDGHCVPLCTESAK
ncbi:hypothetical protein OIO90_003313 [Microbotryomycetes sp. JL221]|nr:hypothetical protein OIO90_003313 [Microbotryomycetes sp. JL221]